jgi:hypothetical protein
MKGKNSRETVEVARVFLGKNHAANTRSFAIKGLRLAGRVGTAGKRAVKALPARFV